MRYDDDIPRTSDNSWMITCPCGTNIGGSANNPPAKGTIEVCPRCGQRIQIV
jgi:hypothetical protein